MHTGHKPRRSRSSLRWVLMLGSMLAGTLAPISAHAGAFDDMKSAAKKGAKKAKQGAKKAKEGAKKGAEKAKEGAKKGADEAKKAADKAKG